MSQCPLCHAPVMDDFGLIECAGCGAQLIVHMDGRVEYQGAKETAVFREEVAPSKPFEDSAIGEIEVNFAEKPTVMHDKIAESQSFRTIPRPKNAANPGKEDLVPPGNTEAGYRMPEDDLYDVGRDYTSEVKAATSLKSDAEPSDNPPDLPPALRENGEPEKEFLGASFADAHPESEPEPEEEFQPESQEDEFESQFIQKMEETEPEPEPEQPAQGAAQPPAETPDLFADFDSDQPAPQGAVYNSASAPSSPDMSDVARFGNSDLSGGREGPLRYTLFIEGIDTVDVREAFREAITDRKLMWDTDQILRSVRNGRVNIQNVAPTKAYILITRLRGMPVQVRWEQYAISQT